MLCFIGLGINGYSGLSVLAKETLLKCHFIYIERFTSYIDDDDIRQLKILLNNGNKRTQIVPRWFIEDARSIISQSNGIEMVARSIGLTERTDAIVFPFAFWL